MITKVVHNSKKLFNNRSSKIIIYVKIVLKNPSYNKIVMTSLNQNLKIIFREIYMIFNFNHLILHLTIILIEKVTFNYQFQIIILDINILFYIIKILSN